MGAVLEGFGERARERVVVGDFARNVIGPSAQVSSKSSSKTDPPGSRAATVGIRRTIKVAYRRARAADRITNI
jgi:hypothetical protein